MWLSSRQDLYVAPASLELPMQIRLASISEICLSLNPDVGQMKHSILKHKSQHIPVEFQYVTNRAFSSGIFWGNAIAFGRRQLRQQDGDWVGRGTGWWWEPGFNSPTNSFDLPVWVSYCLSHLKWAEWSLLYFVPHDGITQWNYWGHSAWNVKTYHIILDTVTTVLDR